MTKKPERKQLHAWISIEIKERLEQWKSDHKSTYSEILDEALASYFSMTPEAKYFSALDAKMEQMEASRKRMETKIDRLVDALSSRSNLGEEIAPVPAPKVDPIKQVDLVEEVESKEEVLRHAKELERAKQQAQHELQAQRTEKARQAQRAKELEQDVTAEMPVPKPPRKIHRNRYRDD